MNVFEVRTWLLQCISTSMMNDANGYDVDEDQNED